MNTWIKPDDVLSLWTFVIGWAAISIWLEQKYKWAATLTGCMIALLGAMIFANLGVVPLDTPTYDLVWGFVVPIAVPLLLFDADIRRIWRESGRTFIAYHFAVLGTIIGTIIATLLFYDKIPEIRGILAMISGSYIGGSINLAAMKAAFNVSPEMTSSAIVADNFLMAIYFFALMAIPNMLFFRKRYNMPYDAKMRANEGTDQGENRAAAFWGRKEISLLDIAANVAVAIAIVTFSTKMAEFINAQEFFPRFIKMFLGQKYLLITTSTVILASVFPRFFAAIRGSKEIGSFFIHIFFVVIGVPASLSMIFNNSPLLFVFAAVIVIVNLIVTLTLGKLFKFDLEELLVSCNATIGGPTTAAAMVIAKGWTDLVVPALLVGVWGYVIGNYAAIALANFLGSALSLP
ncbi:MAG: DUF819 family protein [Synergistaceae bacterium]|nr:DUF819 family protein [Synergistaceae bacterium]